MSRFTEFGILTRRALGFNGALAGLLLYSGPASGQEAPPDAAQAQTPAIPAREQVAAQEPGVAIQAKLGTLPVPRPAHVTQRGVSAFAAVLKSTRLDGAGGSELVASVTASTHVAAYADQAASPGSVTHVSARSSFDGQLGGGQAGLDGQLSLDTTTGFRLSPAPDHGVLFRLGLQGLLRGNDLFYTSLLELPVVEVGYQLLRHDLMLELAPRVGAVLIGRYHPGDAERRKLGNAYSWGGQAALGWQNVQLDLVASRVQLDEDPVDFLTAELCAGADLFVGCTNVSVTRAEVRGLAGSGEARVWVLGLLLGFGTHSGHRIVGGESRASE